MPTHFICCFLCKIKLIWNIILSTSWVFFNVYLHQDEKYAKKFSVSSKNVKVSFCIYLIRLLSCLCKQKINYELRQCNSNHFLLYPQNNLASKFRIINKEKQKSIDREKKWISLNQKFSPAVFVSSFLKMILSLHLAVELFFAKIALTNWKLIINLLPVQHAETYLLLLIRTHFYFDWWTQPNSIVAMAAERTIRVLKSRNIKRYVRKEYSLVSIAHLQE